MPPGALTLPYECGGGSVLIRGRFASKPCPSSGACQTAVAASGFHMNVEVEVFSAVVGLLANHAHHQEPVKLPLQPLVSV